MCAVPQDTTSTPATCVSSFPAKYCANFFQISFWAETVSLLISLSCLLLEIEVMAKMKCTIPLFIPSYLSWKSPTLFVNHFSSCQHVLWGSFWYASLSPIFSQSKHASKAVSAVGSLRSWVVSSHSLKSAPPVVQAFHINQMFLNSCCPLELTQEPPDTWSTLGFRASVSPWHFAKNITAAVTSALKREKQHVNIDQRKVRALEATPLAVYWQDSQAHPSCSQNRERSVPWLAVNEHQLGDLPPTKQSLSTCQRTACSGLTPSLSGSR